jgi:hypothetical protein
MGEQKIRFSSRNATRWLIWEVRRRPFGYRQSCVSRRANVGGRPCYKVSKYQISNCKYGKPQQDSGDDSDEKPTPKTWTRSWQSQHVLGQVRWKRV